MSQGMDRVFLWLMALASLACIGVEASGGDGGWSLVGLVAVLGGALCVVKGLSAYEDRSLLSRALEDAAVALKTAQEAKTEAARARELATQAPRRGPSL